MKKSDSKVKAQSKKKKAKTNTKAKTKTKTKTKAFAETDASEQAHADATMASNGGPDIMTQPSPDAPEDRRKVVEFFIGEDTYAIYMEDLIEVILMPEVTEVPKSPDTFLGVSNIRGHVYPILDLAAHLNIEPKKSHEEAVIFVHDDGVDMGVRVDMIKGINHVTKSLVSPPKALKGKKRSEFISGIYGDGKNLTLLLSVKKLLSKHERDFLEAV